MKLKDFMKKIGCEKWPERWNEIFEDALKALDDGEVVCLNPEYYEYLDNRYKMMGDYLEIYKEAAEEIRSDRDLSILLSLLCKAVKNREKIRGDLKEYKHPEKIDGKSELAVNMLTGLAVCSMADYTYNLFKKRSIPEEHIQKCMELYVDGVIEYRRRHNGEYGYMQFGWYQHAIDARLIPMGRLQIEVNCKFYGYATIFKNKNGDVVALAEGIPLHKSGYALGTKCYEDDEGAWAPEITENEEYWEGHPYMDNSYVSHETVRLYKNEWEKLFSHEGDVIGLHIPSQGKLTPEEVDKSLEAAKIFLDKYYPDYNYKGFACCSWLMDPQLEHLLDSESNIVKFNKRFKKVNLKNNGAAIFYFVFLRVNESCDNVAELETKTSLEKKLKEHYMNGNVIYETVGYFLR